MGDAKALFGKSESYNAALWAAALERIPEFFYFADYSKLPYSVKIQHVLKGDRRGHSGSQLGIHHVTDIGSFLEVEHFSDHAHEGLGGDAGHASQLDSLLDRVPEGEKGDWREVGRTDRGVKSLCVLDRIESAHGGPHFLGWRVGGNAMPEA
jgi:hypothetical protein